MMSTTLAIVAAATVLRNIVSVAWEWAPSDPGPADYYVVLRIEPDGSTTSIGQTVEPKWYGNDCYAWPQPVRISAMAYKNTPEGLLSRSGPISDDLYCPATAVGWDPDFDGDGDCDAQDYSMGFSPAFTTGEPLQGLANYDADGNGVVDSRDADAFMVCFNLGADLWP